MKNLQINKDELFQKFKKSLKTFTNLSNENKIIVSVSGGVDSVALLTLLKEVDCFQLIVVHINHNLRKDSNLDKEFVKDISDKFDIPFHCISLDPKSRNKKHSVEQWARIERYAFLNDIFKKEKCDWIMTAHHANDQAETILMNLTRKSGIAGLRGVARQKNKILRPMIDFKKKEIVEFSKRIGLSFREDETNRDNAIPRNFLRHQIIKPWENKFPEVIPSILESSKYFSEWSNGLDDLISRFIIPNLNIGDETIEIPTELLNTIPSIVRIRLIRLLSFSIDDQWSKHSIAMLDQFLDKSMTGDIHILLNGWRLLRDRDLIKMKRKQNKLIDKSVRLEIDIPIVHNNYIYEINLDNKDIKDTKANNHEIVDWEKLRDTKLEIRSWKEGDVFQPLGMKGHQKVSDFLINEKVDRLEKEYQSVLTADGEIIWICGKRLSNSVKITKKTNQRAVLSRGLIQ